MDMKMKKDPMRENARKLIEPGVLDMNASNSVNRAKNPMVSRSKIANDRPLTFAQGGKVKKMANGGPMAVAPLMAGRAFKKGGKVDDDVAQDKKIVTKAINQHDNQLHGGKKTHLKLACGGKVMKKARGGMMSSPQKSPANGIVKKTPIAQTYAAGGSAKVRKNMMTPEGAIKQVVKKGSGNIF